MSFQVNGKLMPPGGGDPIPLIRDNLVIGRRESCDICLRYPNVSQQHARLTFVQGYWYIQDLNSTNGIKVNGQRVQKKILHPEDEITLAKRKYTIQYALPSDHRAPVEEEEEDVMGKSLLERAGLERSKSRDDDEDDFPRRSRPVLPASDDDQSPMLLDD